MAQAEQRLNTQDRCIIAAAAAYCAENDAIERLCEQYDTLPDELADPYYERMQAAKRRTLRGSAVSRPLRRVFRFPQLRHADGRGRRARAAEASQGLALLRHYQNTCQKPRYGRDHHGPPDAARGRERIRYILILNILILNVLILLLRRREASAPCFAEQLDQLRAGVAAPRPPPVRGGVERGAAGLLSRTIYHWASPPAAFSW